MTIHATVNEELNKYLEERWKRLSDKTKSLLNLEEITCKMFMEALWTKQFLDTKLLEIDYRICKNCAHFEHKDEYCWWLNIFMHETDFCSGFQKE